MRGKWRRGGGDGTEGTQRCDRGGDEEYERRDRRSLRRLRGSVTPSTSALTTLERENKRWGPQGGADPRGLRGKKFGAAPSPTRPLPQFPATPFLKLLSLPPGSASSQEPLPHWPTSAGDLPPGLPIGPLSGEGGGRRCGWRRVAQAQRRAEGAGRAVREAEGESGPGGSPWREDGELRALVAVKRVIDFAVKVTAPLLSLVPEPCGRVLPGSRAPTV